MNYDYGYSIQKGLRPTHCCFFLQDKNIVYSWNFKNELLDYLHVITSMKWIKGKQTRM